MSMDYPVYEWMKKGSPRAALWWIIGDRLYYLGLLAAMLIPIGAVVSFVISLVQSFRVPYLSLIGWWVLSVAVFFLGTTCKGRSYKLAKLDGIDMTRF